MSYVELSHGRSRPSHRLEISASFSQGEGLAARGHPRLADALGQEEACQKDRGIGRIRGTFHLTAQVQRSLQLVVGASPVPIDTIDPGAEGERKGERHRITDLLADRTGAVQMAPGCVQLATQDTDIGETAVCQPKGIQVAHLLDRREHGLADPEGILDAARGRQDMHELRLCAGAVLPVDAGPFHRLLRRRQRPAVLSRPKEELPQGRVESRRRLLEVAVQQLLQARDARQSYASFPPS